MAIGPDRDRGGRAAPLLLRLLLLFPAPVAAAYYHKLMFRTPFVFIIERKGATATAMEPGAARSCQLSELEEPRRVQFSAQRSSGDAVLGWAG